MGLVRARAGLERGEKLPGERGVWDGVHRVYLV